MAIQFDQRSLPIGRIQRRIPAPTRARTKVALVFDDSLFVGERLIERKWRQNSADLCSVPRRHFRSNHVVLGASHSRLRGPGGAGMAAEWSPAWCWEQVQIPRTKRKYSLPNGYDYRAGGVGEPLGTVCADGSRASIVLARNLRF